MDATKHERSVIGVDAGTTSAKAVAYDARGRRLAAAAIGYDAPDPAVLDPHTVLDATMEAIADTARRAGADIAGLALGSAMHALVALGAGDRPLTPIITWADGRAAEQAQRLRATHPELHDRTGTPVHAMAPLAKLVWFAEREPETFAAAERWVGVKELLVARLTGTLAVDHSIASGTGLLNLTTLDWDPEALALAGIGPDHLAPLHPATDHLPLSREAAERLGLEPGLPVVIGAADGPLANLGVGATAPGVAAVSIGTSGALRVVVERPAIDPHRQVFCFALTPGRWVVGGAISNGGVVLEWAGEALAPELGAHAEEALLALAAEAPPGSDGLLMLPQLTPERAPVASSARGAYVGLTRGHGRPHLIRAAVEGVCLQLATVLQAVRAAGHDVREVRATGGFARSALWRQILADVLDMPIGFPAGEAGSALGAALLGMEALGLARAGEVARTADVVTPDPAAAEVYGRALPAFAALAERLR